MEASGFAGKVKFTAYANGRTGSKYVGQRCQNLRLMLRKVAGSLAFFSSRRLRGKIAKSVIPHDVRHAVGNVDAMNAEGGDSATIAALVVEEDHVLVGDTSATMEVFKVNAFVVLMNLLEIDTLLHGDIVTDADLAHTFVSPRRFVRARGDSDLCIGVSVQLCEKRTRIAHQPHMCTGAVYDVARRDALKRRAATAP